MPIASTGSWTNLDNYILCYLKDKGRTSNYIAKVLQGRTEAAVTARFWSLENKEKPPKINPNYWAKRLEEEQISLPTEEQLSPGIIKNRRKIVKEQSDTVTVAVGDMEFDVTPPSNLSFRLKDRNLVVSIGINET